MLFFFKKKKKELTIIYTSSLADAFMFSVPELHAPRAYLVRVCQHGSTFDELPSGVGAGRVTQQEQLTHCAFFLRAVCVLCVLCVLAGIKWAGYARYKVRHVMWVRRDAI